MSGPPRAAPGTGSSVRLLTLNLWGRRGPDERRMAALVEHLQRHRYDLIALQEVEGTGRDSQAHELADAVGYRRTLLVRTGRTSLRGEGLAIVTDLDVEPIDRVELPTSVKDHPRALQQANVVLEDGTAVRVGNTHLAWRLDHTELRAQQTRVIRDALRGWSGAVVLAGDLNDVADSPAVRALTEADQGWEPLTDALVAAGGEPRPTFDEDNPHMWQPQLAGRRIDHLLVRGLEAVEAQVVLDGRGSPVVSDHYGVEARLRSASDGGGRRDGAGGA